MFENDLEEDILDEMNRKFESHLKRSGIHSSTIKWSMLKEGSFDWDYYENIVSCEN